MKSNIPWSVKGIDPEAREAAKIAARRAGMTLGEWLNSLILQSGELPEGFAEQLMAGEEEDERNGDDVNEDEASATPEELQERLETLSRRLDPAERKSLSSSGIDQSIERLANTIESSRRLLASGEVAQRTINDLSHRVERLQERLEQVATQHRSGLEPKTLIALERAIAGVASHIEKSDRRNTELVQSVEDALGQLGSRVDGAESIANDAVSRIDFALDRLSGRIDTTEAEQRRSSARLNERLAQIDERLILSGSEREATLSTVERRLSAFESKLQSVQSRIETAAIARPNIPPDVMTRAEFEEWSQRAGVDQGETAAGLKRSISAIEARVGTLVDRIDRLRQESEDRARNLELKSEEATRQSAAQAKAIETQTAATISEMRISLTEVAQKSDRDTHTATETMSALEGVLRSLTRRLDTMEGKAARTGDTGSAAARAAGAEQRQAEDSEDTSIATSDLPKRPSWTWGLARQGTAQEDGDEARSGTPHRALGASTHADEAPEETASAFDESGLSPEAATEEEAAADQEAVVANENGESVVETVSTGEADLSNLNFDLSGAREAEPEDSDWRAQESWRKTETRTEPTFDRETPESEEPASSGGWLEQARRAAKAASPGERVSDFTIEDEEHGPGRALLILLGVIAALIVVAALGWFVLRPLVGGGAHQAKPAAPAGAHAPASAPSHPATPGVPAPQSANPSAPPLAAPSGAATSPGAAQEELPPATKPSSESAAGQQPANAASGEQAAPPTPISRPAEAAPPGPQTGNAAPASTPAPATAEDALKAAAANGDARAQYALALAYKTGRGVAADSAKALTLMTQAAAAGLAVAQNTLGIWYEQGNGVDKDVTKARQWYEKAANNNNVQGMHNIGYFYAQGLGGLTPDAATAESWFQKAAEHGVVDSEVNLARMYAQSTARGGPSKLDQAYYWSSIAAKEGDPEAAQMRDTLAASLTPDVKSQMDQQVAAWKPQPVDIVANGGFDTSPEAFVPNAGAQALSRAEITSIQQGLNKLGFDAGTADGLGGAQTTAAIKAFQAAYGLPQTGALDRSLLAALDAVPH